METGAPGAALCCSDPDQFLFLSGPVLVTLCPQRVPELGWGSFLAVSLRPGSGVKSASGKAAVGGQLWRVVPSLGVSRSSPGLSSVCSSARPEGATCGRQGANWMDAGTQSAGEGRLAGAEGGHGANLPSIRASFRVAKPFPYVGLRELQSSGQGVGGGRPRRVAHPSALHKPVVCWPGSGA